MGIQKKFFFLAGVVGVIMFLVSCIGYYFSSTALNTSIEGEMNSVVDSQKNKLVGWLSDKEAFAYSAARLMHVHDDGTRTEQQLQDMLGIIGEDADKVTELGVGVKTGTMFAYRSGSSTGKIIPAERQWYKDGVAAGGKVA